MSDKLPHDKDRHLNVIGNGALLKGAGMPILIKVDEKLFILLDALAGAFVRNPSRFNNPEIGSQMVDVADISLSKNRDCVARFHEGFRKETEEGYA